MTSSFEIIFKQKIKYANILFSVSLFYMLGIFVFNSNINSINETEEKLENNFSNKLERVKRLELYEKDKNEFIKKYIFSEIQKASIIEYNGSYLLEIPYLNYYDSDNLQPVDGFNNKIPQKNKDSINTIINNCDLFAKKFNSILETTNIENKLVSTLTKKSLDSIFNNKKISEILDSEWNIKLVKLMKSPTDSDVYYTFIGYILTGSSMGYPSAGGGLLSPRKISYVENYKSDVSSITVGKFYYRFLSNQNIEEIKVFLLNDLSFSFSELKKFKSSNKKLSTNIIGVNIDFNYIFLLSGLVLFFFLALFYIYHKIESNKIEEGKLSTEYLFPNFISLKKDQL